MRSIEKKIEYAALWAATVMLALIIINMQNNEAIDWIFAIAAGLAVGTVNFLWAVIREKIGKRKKRKKESESSLKK